MRFSVLGAGGFIGSHLVRHLHAQGHECRAVGREDALPRGESGHLVYCIGLTADFRSRWLDTARAHVCLLAEYLAGADFESFLYLSSTRVYRRNYVGDEEALLSVSPLDPSDLYNLTKLAGESLCFASARRGVRVVRLSNVYGADFSSDNFLCSLIREAVDQRRIVLQTALDSAKDYVSIADVVDLLPRIASSGSERIYNVASGHSVSNRALVDCLAELTGCAVETNVAAPSVAFPAISVVRVCSEFGYRPRSLLEDLPALVDEYKTGRR